MATTFTNDYGEAVTVSDDDTEVIEETTEYTIIGGPRQNPSGSRLVKVVYKNPGGMGTALPSAVYDDEPDALGVEEEIVMEDISSAMNSMEENEPINNPKGSSTITWRNLRLQTAIDGEARFATAKKAKAAIRTVANLKGLIGARMNQNTSIRNFPELLPMASADDWYDYVRRMTAIDVGAELSYEVSRQEQLAIYAFVKEWEMDPSHNSFRNRVSPGADINSELAKGQILYDIMTSKGPDPLKSAAYDQHKYDKMFKLGLDLLRSMRLNTYNYYSLNSVHVDEGDRVFMDFRSRYVPLSAQDVEMVTEMEQEVASGKSYAFRTTKDENRALEADSLMRKAVASYQVGDTRTTRAVLDVLKEAPYNYEARSMRVRNAHEKGVKDNEIFAVSVAKKLRSSVPEHLFEGNRLWVTGFDMSNSGVKKQVMEGKLPSPNNVKGNIFVVSSFFDPKMVGVLQVKGKEWVYSDYSADFLKKAEKFEDRKQHDKRKKIQQSAKKNPRKNPKGRGNFLFLEVHPKNQLEMKRGAGEHKHGKSKDTTKWSKGLNKFFPGVQMVQVGKLKRTGQDAPYRIRLPTSHFKPATHPTKGYKTIALKKEKSNKQLVAAYQRLINAYGLPKMSSSAGTHYRFIIPKDERGSYYTAVRRQTGKAKASR